MRTTIVALSLAGALALTGCTAPDESADPLAERSGPETLVPEEFGEDVVDLARVQDQIDDLRAGLDDTEADVRAEAETALDDAQAALDEAEPARDSSDQTARDAAVERLEAASEALQTTREDAADAFGRALDTLDADLRRLAEELRQAPG